MGTQLPSLKRGGGTAHVYYGQMVGWIKMPLSMGVGLGPGHILLDGDPAPLQKKRHSPQFSTHVCCGQTAGWIKMPLGTKLGLGPGHSVNRTHLTPPKGHNLLPIFGPCLLWPNSRPSRLLLSTFLFVYEISRGTTQRICAKFTRETCMSLAQTSLKVKVKGQRSR